jgi:hypothetical protein
VTPQSVVCNNLTLDFARSPHAVSALPSAFDDVTGNDVLELSLKDGATATHFVMVSFDDDIRFGVNQEDFAWLDFSET